MDVDVPTPTPTIRSAINVPLPVVTPDFYQRLHSYQHNLIAPDDPIFKSMQPIHASRLSRHMGTA